MRVLVNTVYWGLAIVILGGISKPAYAYLDPGTGSIILQSIIGTVAAALTFGAVYWAKLKDAVRRMLGKSPTLDGNDDE
jgi:hypothetical protein